MKEVLLKVRWATNIMEEMAEEWEEEAEEQEEWMLKAVRKDLNIKKLKF